MYSDDDEDDFEEDDWEAEEPCFKRYKLENSRSSKCVQNVKYARHRFHTHAELSDWNHPM